ncbi:MAG: hypothetical protein M1812_003002 [Candelaria pacifica]|nr:MAG: hypothetical protein M1812_003002 [Candelaria pacifica]
MSFQCFLQLLGDVVTDPEEGIKDSDLLFNYVDSDTLDLESFLLFSQSIPSQNLGFVDSKATLVELTVAGQDLAIHQSPTILSSNRKEGTTGGVLWKVTPLFAEWIVSSGNFLLQNAILGPQSNVLELGCGLSGVLALVLAPKINSFIATDQEYVMKYLKQNIAENSQQARKCALGRQSKGKNKRSTKIVDRCPPSTGNVQLIPLDWELDSLSTLSSLIGASDPGTSKEVFVGLDAVIACDCIYNEGLMQPFVQTCADICTLRERSSENSPTICIVAQQLRSSDIFEAWLIAFHKLFQVWRIPDELLIDGLRENSGFVVHIGILKNDKHQAESS